LGLIANASDQQSYEKKAVYLSQFFKQNNPFVELVQKKLTPASIK
jgi:hypothetical protein